MSTARAVLTTHEPPEIREGLPVSEINLLQEALGLSQATVAALLLISERTLARRRAEGHLTQAESDRLVRLLRLIDDATEAFDQDRSAAAEWLTAPHQLLGGETPLQHADTEPGRETVRDMLGVIQYTMAA